MWPTNHQDSLWEDGTASSSPLTQDSIKTQAALKKQTVLGSSEARLRQLSGEGSARSKKASRRRGRKRMPAFLRAASSHEIDTNVTSTTNPPLASLKSQTTAAAPSLDFPTKTSAFSSTYRRKTRKTLKSRTTPAPTTTFATATPTQPRWTPLLLGKMEACARTLLIILFAIGFGLDLMRKMSRADTETEPVHDVDRELEQSNVYVLEEDEEHARGNFGRNRGPLLEKDTDSDLYTIVNAANSMQTNYIVSVVVLVCSIVTLLFSAMRLYWFPFALGKDNMTKAPEAQLFRLLVSRTGAWYETVWKVLKCTKALFDDVCVFVVALILTMCVMSINEMA